MPSLSDIITSATPAPPKLLIYGMPGAGKTTLAAEAGALVIDCENGAGAIPNLHRTPYLRSWPQVDVWLDLLLEQPPEEHGYPAVAIDTLDWLLHRICEHVVIDLDPKNADAVTNTLGSSHGGYFKAREIVQNIVSRSLLPALNALTDRGIAVILLAHAAHTKWTSPEGLQMRTAGPDLPEWIAPLFVEWADAVLYLRHERDERTFVTQGGNTIVAKNRYGLAPTIAGSWPSLTNAIDDGLALRQQPDR
jgi:AAA domain